MVDKISFSKDDIKMFQENSLILLKNIDSLQKIKKNDGILIKNKQQLDSLLIKNKFNFSSQIDAVIIYDDFINYSLKSDKGRVIQLDPYMNYQHSIIFTKHKNAGVAIINRTENGNEIEQRVFLIENGSVNPKWAEQWFEMNMIYSKKLSNNLYYIILEISTD